MKATLMKALLIFKACLYFYHFKCLCQHGFSFSFISTLIGLIAVYHTALLLKKRLFKFTWNNHLFFSLILPWLGNCYVLFVSLLFCGTNVSKTSKWIKKYFGYPFNLWIGSSYYYVTINPSEIKTVLNHPKCYNKGDVYRSVDFGFKNSLTMVDYEEWKARRKFFQNSYKPFVLKSFIPTFYKQSCKLDLQNLDKKTNIFNFFGEYAFINYCLTSAGLKEENCSSDLKHELQQILVRIQENLKLPIVHLFVPTSIWEYLFPSGKQHAKNRNRMIKIINELVWQKQKDKTPRKDDNNTDNVMPLFDLLLNVYSKNKSEKEVFEEILFFTVAATETTGNALAFCFTLLGMHPEIQDTLYQEIIEQVAFGEILSEDLPKLKYTEAVISETLRLFPTLPFIARYIDADVNLGVKCIPKGSQVAIDIFSLQRDEKYWPDPLKFNPTRFLPDNASKITSYSFIPFSAGPRDCLGKGQSMAVMKTTVASIVRKYRITSKHKTIDEFHLLGSVTLKTAHPLDCQFQLRLEE